MNTAIPPVFVIIAGNIRNLGSISWYVALVIAMLMYYEKRWKALAVSESWMGQTFSLRHNLGLGISEGQVERSGQW